MPSRSSNSGSTCATVSAAISSCSESRSAASRSKRCAQTTSPPARTSRSLDVYPDAAPTALNRTVQQKIQIKRFRSSPSVSRKSCHRRARDAGDPAEARQGGRDFLSQAKRQRVITGAIQHAQRHHSEANTRMEAAGGRGRRSGTRRSRSRQPIAYFQKRPSLVRRGDAGARGQSRPAAIVCQFRATLGPPEPYAARSECARYPRRPDLSDEAACRCNRGLRARRADQYLVRRGPRERCDFAALCCQPPVECWIKPDQILEQSSAEKLQRVAAARRHRVDVNPKPFVAQNEMRAVAAQDIFPNGKEHVLQFVDALAQGRPGLSASASCSRTGPSTPLGVPVAGRPGREQRARPGSFGRAAARRARGHPVPSSARATAGANGRGAPPRPLVWEFRVRG